LINKFNGGDRIRHIVGYYTACRSWSVGYVKSRLKINAKAIANAVEAVKSVMTNVAEFFFAEEPCLMAA